MYQFDPSSHQPLSLPSELLWVSQPVSGSYSLEEPSSFREPRDPSSQFHSSPPSHALTQHPVSSLYSPDWPPQSPPSPHHSSTISPD